MRSILLSLLLSCIISQSAKPQITWQKHSDNPVLRFWTGNVDDPNGYNYALDPTPLVDQTGIYHMWFTSSAYGYGTSFCVSETFSVDGTRWFTYFKNPVLRPGPLGTFEERGVRPQSVVRDNTGYKMYYMGLTIGNDHAIGLATSTDGISWAKHPGNPILDAGPPGTWDSLKISTASVYFDGTNYSMWYTGENGGKPAIGLATSTDGVTWIKHPGNPVLVVGTPGSWDDESVEAPKIIRVGSTFHMFYNGNAVSSTVNAFHIGYAQSSDGVNWTKYSGNPVLLIGSSSEWDGQSLGTMAVIYQDNKFHLWYSGLGLSPLFPQAWQTGYATSDHIPGSVVPSNDIPESILLSQCYPNPFNPSTVIRYQLPSQSYVTLQVFDVLGREVATLVDALEEPGYKSVAFDATKLATGEYFYRLSAAGLIETKKMSYVK